MACNITEGFINDCLDSQGGLETIYLTNGPVDSITETAGVVSAITVGGTPLVPADWFEFQVPRATSDFSETITPSQENGTVTYQQDLNMVFNKMSADKRNQILLMAENNKLIAVAKDNNGILWSIGLERGAYMTTSVGSTSVGYADRNGYTITISGMEASPSYVIDPAIVIA